MFQSYKVKIDCSKEDASSMLYVVMTLSYSLGHSGICLILKTRTACIVAWQGLDAFLLSMIQFEMGAFEMVIVFRICNVFHFVFLLESHMICFYPLRFSYPCSFIWLGLAQSAPNLLNYRTKI